MTDSVNEQDASPEDSPFSPGQAPGVSLIVLMRIYDVLMAQLTISNPEAASNLMEIHANGTIMGSSPRITGNFIYDEINSSPPV